MAAGATEDVEDRARMAGIVLMSLLSAILVFVLLRTRPPESPKAQEPPSPQSVEGAEVPPARQAPGASDYYRGWPLFEGWPLPQLPSGTGGGGSQHEPEAPPNP